MSMDQLLAVMRRLRDPQGGCAWDLEQTMRSIVPHTLEEAYEVADAIERDDTTAVRDELGDLLYQVVFLARIAEEAGQFDFDDVARAIADKLVRRHPHVFGETQNLSAEQQTLAWEGYKQTERAEAGEQGTLDGVALALPALTRAVKLGKRAARVHFDWPDASHMRAKLDEELAEFEETLRERESVERQSEELGDLLFVVANWARHLKLDPEVALRQANAKFESRFRCMVSFARDRGLVLEQLDLDAWEALWQEAKIAEKAVKTAAKTA
jgi:MazG family protein